MVVIEFCVLCIWEDYSFTACFFMADRRDLAGFPICFEWILPAKIQDLCDICMIYRARSAIVAALSAYLQAEASKNRPISRQKSPISSTNFPVFPFPSAVFAVRFRRVLRESGNFDRNHSDCSRAHAKSSEVPAGFFEKSADEQFATRDLSKHRSPVFQRAARRVSPPCGGIRCALGTLRELARLSPTADRGNERGVAHRKTKTAPLRMEKRRQCEGDQARAIRDWG